MLGNETAANDAAAAVATRPKFPGKWNRSPNYRIAWGDCSQPIYWSIPLLFTTRPQNIPRLKLRSREVHYNVIRFSNCWHYKGRRVIYIKACILFFLFIYFFFLFCFALLISRAERRRSLRRLALCWNKNKKGTILSSWKWRVEKRRKTTTKKKTMRAPQEFHTETVQRNLCRHFWELSKLLGNCYWKIRGEKKRGRHLNAHRKKRYYQREELVVVVYTFIKKKKGLRSKCALSQYIGAKREV